ncbi:MAG: hypothetical protein Q9162_000519 [Coniocarpon cinnabarinum]
MTLLLKADGLWEHATNQGTGSILKRPHDPERTRSISKIREQARLQGEWDIKDRMASTYIMSCIEPCISDALRLSTFTHAHQKWDVLKEHFHREDFEDLARTFAQLDVLALGDCASVKGFCIRFQDYVKQLNDQNYDIDGNGNGTTPYMIHPAIQICKFLEQLCKRRGSHPDMWVFCDEKILDLRRRQFMELTDEDLSDIMEEAIAFAGNLSQ